MKNLATIIEGVIVHILNITPKKNAKGEVERYKAQLMTKGYSQKVGTDYDEVFALLARLETVRLIISLVAQNNWRIHQVDVKSSFLNGVLEEEV